MSAFRNTLMALPMAASAAPAVLDAPARPSRSAMSVHVLNLETGLPSAGMQVTLERKQGEAWTRIAGGSTDADGRIEALYPADAALEHADYRVTFNTGEWYASKGAAVFYPVIQVVVRVDGSVPHYHIPVLLSTYGYSTYRGS